MTGRWFSQGPPVSSTNKTDRHDIAEILLKLALSTINQQCQPSTPFQSWWQYYWVFLLVTFFPYRYLILECQININYNNLTKQKYISTKIAQIISGIKLYCYWALLELCSLLLSIILYCTLFIITITAL